MAILIYENVTFFFPLLVEKGNSYTYLNFAISGN